ncbi:MAG: DUF86 domain-containing protein [Chloroflexi bacterium]|nr:MAG: DUF86 domain-containing protein [Chloroflexota bacterium]
MVDPDILASILNNLRGYLKKLAILAALPPQEFTRYFTNVESAKHLLQVSIECCLDIAHHIVSDEGYRIPENYYDTFVVLHEEGILPADFMPTLRQMVSFRNRMVHLYWDIDDTIVYRILQENLDDFNRYITYIQNFVRDETAAEK